MKNIKRERWFNTLEDTPDLEFHHYGKDTEGNFCMINPEKVVLDVFPDGRMELKL